MADRDPRRDRSREPLAVATVEAIADATSEIVTRDILRAELSHALLIFGGVIVSANIGVAALTLAAMKLFFF